MENGDRHTSSKKARTEPTGAQVKQETEETEQTGSGALVAVEGAAPRGYVTVALERAALHCPVCTLPFTPPIYQCEAGHLVCNTCHGQLPKLQCYACGRSGLYRRSTPLENVVGAAKIPCPYSIYGCRSSVTYHQAGCHMLECPCAPCSCLEQGCAFLGSPPMLLAHLKDAHALPAVSISNGISFYIHLSQSEPRRLLVAEDGRVFVVAVRAHGARQAVSVVCMRASAAAGPQYVCKMSAAGNPGAVTGRLQTAMVEVEVPSCSGPCDAAAAAEAAPLSVPGSMLCGSSKELRLKIRISKQ